MVKIALVASQNKTASKLAEHLRTQYDFVGTEQADVVVVIGGDGSLLHAMRHLRQQAKNIQFYGINAGSHGFLMNSLTDENGKDTTGAGVRIENIIEKINTARKINFPTLWLRAQLVNDQIYENFAINEISLSRASPQAIKMKLSLDGHDRISNMVGDGMLLATPQGSTAYNFACHGPILPLGSSLLALTPISLFRPRRWPGAVVRNTTVIDIELQEHEKRPGVVAVDAILGGEIKKMSMSSHPDLEFCLLVDRNYDLEERIILEQFEV